MPTTKTRATLTQDIGESASTDTQHVYLKQLLDRRHRLAHLAGEEFAHDWATASDTYALQLAVEEEIRVRFAATYAALLPVWAELDASGHHDPEDPRPDCAICAGFVNHRLPPPVGMATE